jgi:hypothetical protein
MSDLVVIIILIEPSEEKGSMWRGRVNKHARDVQEECETKTN